MAFGAARGECDNGARGANIDNVGEQDYEGTATVAFGQRAERSGVVGFSHRCRNARECVTNCGESTRGARGGDIAAHPRVKHDEANAISGGKRDVREHEC